MPLNWAPSPWKYDDNDVIDFNSEVIVSSIDTDFGPEEDKANLRLIAVAPELYEALESFVDWNYEHPVSYSDFEDMLTHAKQVLAKARGKNS